MEMCSPSCQAWLSLRAATRVIKLITDGRDRRKTNELLAGLPINFLKKKSARLSLPEAIIDVEGSKKWRTWKKKSKP